MSRWLDRLYLAAGILAAIFLMAIALLTLLQIGSRWLHVLIPDTAEFAGFSMAASSFLALAYTFRANRHIRVNLIISRVGPKARYIIEVFCLAFAVVSIGFFAWASFKLVFDSYIFGDIGMGMLRTPLWIPQTGMALGVVLFEISLIDELVRSILRKPLVYQMNDADLAPE